MLKNIVKNMKPGKKHYVVVSSKPEEIACMIVALSRVDVRDFEWDTDIILGRDGVFYSENDTDIFEVMSIKINKRGDKKLQETLALGGYKLVPCGYDGFMTKLEQI